MSREKKKVRCWERDRETKKEKLILKKISKETEKETKEKK